MAITLNIYDEETNELWESIELNNETEKLLGEASEKSKLSVEEIINKGFELMIEMFEKDKDKFLAMFKDKK